MAARAPPGRPRRAVGPATHDHRPARVRVRVRRRRRARALHARRDDRAPRAAARSSDLARYRRRARSAWATAYEPVPAVVRLVRRAPQRTALFTNNGPLFEAALDAELSAVGDAFDDLIASWRLGAAKPDPEAFERAGAALGVVAEQIVFFDDTEANVVAAAEAGWDAHRFTTALDAQAVLAARR
ncbi:MAG: HAD-IA family hydrolase [Acidimicrobiales bacterium]